MTVTIMPVQGYEYFLRTVAAGDGDRSLSTPLTRYYAEEGAPPGRWMGSGIASLDSPLKVGDEVTEEQLRLLIGEARHPVTGQDLGRRYRTYKVAEEGKRRHPVAGYDLTFSIPKSASVLWGVSDAGTRVIIADAHHLAVAETIEFLEREVIATRGGARVPNGGVAQLDVTGVIATAFDHYDSRANDPHLHTHVVISNRVKATCDGQWRTIDGARARRPHPGRHRGQACWPHASHPTIHKPIPKAWRGRRGRPRTARRHRPRRSAQRLARHPRRITRPVFTRIWGSTRQPAAAHRTCPRSDAPRPRRSGRTRRHSDHRPLDARRPRHHRRPRWRAARPDRRPDATQGSLRPRQPLHPAPRSPRHHLEQGPRALTPLGHEVGASVSSERIVRPTRSRPRMPQGRCAVGSTAPIGDPVVLNWLGTSIVRWSSPRATAAT